MKTLQSYKAEQLELMILEWEQKLRHSCKYSEKPMVSWDAVRDLYFSIRDDYLVVDLMEDIAEESCL